MPWPVTQTAFRPFFLAAALIAVVVATWWALVLTGGAAAPTVIGPVAWHVHELLYGFAGAVLAGFVLTAGAVWTRRPTVSGAGLVALVVLWIVGRIVMWAPMGWPGWLVAVPDSLWLVGVALGIGIPVVRAKNWRNIGFPLLMLGLAGCHAAPLVFEGQGGWLWRVSWTVAIDLVVVALILVSGRIVPMFSRNGLGEPRIDRWQWADRVTVALVVALVLVDAAMLPSWVSAVVGLLTAVAVVVRAIPWKSWLTWRVPLVWVLHLGVAWIAVGLALNAAIQLGAPLPASAGTHALTVGAIGTLCLGMMSRVALGHTGRALTVGPAVVFAYWVLTLAAVIRVAGPLLSTSTWVFVGAAALFALSFAVYLGGYVGVLLEPRVDGKPG